MSYPARVQPIAITAALCLSACQQDKPSCPPGGGPRPTPTTYEIRVAADDYLKYSTVEVTEDELVIEYEKPDGSRWRVTYLVKEKL